MAERLALLKTEALFHFLRLQAEYLHGLVPGRRATRKLHLVAWQTEDFSKETHQSFIGRRVHRGSRDFDPQFSAMDTGDLVLIRARLSLDEQRHTIRLFAIISCRRTHGRHDER